MKCKHPKNCEAKGDGQQKGKHSWRVCFSGYGPVDSSEMREKEEYQRVRTSLLAAKVCRLKG